MAYATVSLEGLGFSVEFATSTVTARLVAMTAPSRTREAIDDSSISETGDIPFIPSAQIDGGEISLEFISVNGDEKLIEAGTETVSIVYPLESGQVTPLKKNFDAFATSEGGEEFSRASRVTKKVTMKVVQTLADTAAT
jgi:hypothetical protein